MANILPAATVVLLRDSECGLQTLMLRRSTEVSFAKASWVFPGGRIDRDDYAHDVTDIESAARRGAVREAEEETGLIVDPSTLIYFSHWTTPPTSPKRYATWFFVATVSDVHAEVIVDGSEIVDYRWQRPADAVADHHARVMDMMPPTLITLTDLAGYQSVAEALAHCEQRPIPEYQPRSCATERGITLLYRGDAGYDLGDPDEAGPRHRCYLLDEAWRYEKDTP